MADPIHARAAAKQHDKKAWVKRFKVKGVNFRQALTTEVIRADRYRRPLTLVLLRLYRSSDAHESIWEDQRSFMIRALGTAAERTIRVSDFCGPIDAMTYGICLPETDYFGASVTAKKVAKSLAEIKAYDRAGAAIEHIKWNAAQHNGEHDADTFIQSVPEPEFILPRGVLRNPEMMA